MGSSSAASFVAFASSAIGSAFLPERLWRKCEPMLLETPELLLSPSYERIKVKPFQGCIARKCPP